jgi:hypothetical protein
MATRIPTAARNAAANAVVLLADAGPAAGTIQIRTGAQPATADLAATGTLLATLTMSDPSFAAAVAGVSTLDTTPVLTTTGVAAGTAGWFRMLDSNGLTVMDGAVATAGAELNLNTTTISIGVTVEITAGTVTMPAST